MDDSTRSKLRSLARAIPPGAAGASTVPRALIHFVLITALVFTLNACHQGDDREGELGYLRPVIAPALLDVSHLEVAGIEHVKLIEISGEHCLGLRVFQGQRRKNNGVRAEISIDFPYRIGETVRYQWRFFLPQDFVADAPANRWWVLADWHDQPNRDRGETWDGFPSHSAPIIIGYGQLEGKDMLGFSYGSPDVKPVTAIPFTRGRWHSIAMVVTWSRGTEGHAELQLDGAPVARASGPNMLNDFQHYAKIGMYRHPDIAGDDWIYIAGVDIAKLGGQAPAAPSP